MGWQLLHSIQGGVMATPLFLRRNGEGIPAKGVWMATPLSLRRDGDGMATSPFHLKGCGWRSGEEGQSKGVCMATPLSLEEEW